MLRPIDHLFPPITSSVEHYINYATEGDHNFTPGEIVITVIQWLSDHRYHIRVRDTRVFCEMLKMTPEDTLMWVLKYGDTLPNKLDEGTVKC